MIVPKSTGPETSYSSFLEASMGEDGEGYQKCFYFLFSSFALHPKGYEPAVCWRHSQAQVQEGQAMESRLLPQAYWRSTFPSVQLSLMAPAGRTMGKKTDPNLWGSLRWLKSRPSDLSSQPKQRGAQGHNRPALLSG